ncbi:MAG: ATP-binding protein [Pontixanthobacter sp.]
MDAPTAAEQIGGMLFAVLLIDNRFSIVEANNAAEEMLGRSASRLRGMTVADACGLPPNVATRIKDADHQLVARNIVIAPDTREIEVNLTCSPIASHSGWKVVTLSDFGQNDVGREGATMQAPAILAHEIKNPLAAIKGANQLLRRELPSSAQAMTTIVDQEVTRIAALIDSMQALGREHQLPIHAVNLHQTIRRSIASINAAYMPSTSIIEEFDPSLPLVAANDDALMQIFINLLSNAVEAGSAIEDARIGVRTRFISGLTRMRGEGRAPLPLNIEITVYDNGPGLSPGMVDHAFEPFMTTKKSGRGLGLALVRKLTRDMGGRVSYIRDIDKNRTEFRLHLAVAEAQR